MELATLEMPDIIKIDHANGTFIHERDKSLAPEYIAEDRVIIGLVKQRRFWQSSDPHSESGHGWKLGCSSNEGVMGHPTSAFPWGPATFSIQTGATEIKCEECPFNKPLGHYAPDRSTACGHQWLLITSNSDGDGVSILKLNGAAVKAASSHLRPYQVNKMPAFTDTVHFNLFNAKRNGKRYAELQINVASITNKRLWAPVFLPLYKKWSTILETPSSPKASGSNSRGGLRPLSM